MIDKNYCMSSYMAFRYIERDDFDFYSGCIIRIYNRFKKIQKY